MTQPERLLSVAAAAWPGAAVLRLRAACAGGGVGGGGGRRMSGGGLSRPRPAQTCAQLQASDPAVSAFVGASAGSGQDQAADRPPAAADARRARRPSASSASPSPRPPPPRWPSGCKDPGPWVTMDDAALARRAGGAACRTVASDADRRAGAVRPRARSAGRHAHRHDPRLLPVAAAPLPAGGGAVAAFPPGGRARRRGRTDRGARGHAGACQRAAHARGPGDAGRAQLGRSVRPARRGAATRCCRG